MTKNEDLNYSPGKIIILWQLIFYISQNEGARIQDILGVIRDSGTMGGTTPLDGAIRLASYCRFVNIRNEKVFLSDDAKVGLLPLCSTLYPNFEIVRFVTQKILMQSIYKFSWLLFFDTDAEIFKQGIPQDWIEILDSANLLDFEDVDVVAWWKAIIEYVNDFDTLNTKEIGDVGERLTMEYENKRLKANKIRNPHHRIKWVSRFSDRYGYDISSVRGKQLKANGNIIDQIQIDVKSSVSDSENGFRFHVSKNEYLTAMENIDTYYFYCWIDVNVETKKAYGPYIVPAKKIRSHFPNDTSEICEWSECRFKIDLKKYSF